MKHPEIMSLSSKRWQFILIAVILILSASQAVSAPDLPMFTKQTELGPIVLSYSDVDQLVTSLKAQIEIANRHDKSDRSGKMTLSVEAGEDIISVNSWRSLSDASRLPEPGKRLSFDYSSYDMPIERVEISLDNYQRRITVKGTQRDQVDAIYAYIKDALTRRIWPWQGPLLRFAGGFITFIIGFQLAWLPITARPLFRRFYSSAKIVAIQVLGILIAASPFILPWDTLLPGFAVYSRTDNTDRMIGLAGLAFGVIPLMVWLLRPKLISPEQSASESSTSHGDSG
jgi:hypothetical protein